MTVCITTLLDKDTYLTLIAAGYEVDEIEACRQEWLDNGLTNEEWCIDMKALARAIQVGVV